MKQKTKCYFSIFSEVLILLLQIFCLFMYTQIYGNRKNYTKFMKEIKSFIDINKLDPNYMKKFEKVFGDEWKEFIQIGSNFVKFMYMTFFNFLVGIILIVGVIVNSCSICDKRSRNRIGIGPLVLFSISSIVTSIELIYSIFGEKTSLDLSEDDLKKFEPKKKLIEDNLNEVKSTVLSLRIYLVIVVATSGIQLLLTIFIKSNVRVSSITQTLNSENNEILTNENE